MIWIKQLFCNHDFELLLELSVCNNVIEKEEFHCRKCGKIDVKSYPKCICNNCDVTMFLPQQNLGSVEK